MKKKNLFLICAFIILSATMISCNNSGLNEDVRSDVSEPVTEAASIEVDISYGNSLDTASEPESDPEPKSETMTEVDKSEDSESYDDPQFTIMDPDLDIVVTDGTEYYEGFQVDNILHSSDGLPDLYYHIYVPESYNGDKAYALYIVLPGHGAYYFDGKKSAKNLYDEYYATEAKKYNDEMIIVAPQLEDYDEEMDDLAASEEIHKPQVIRLTEYILSTYNINRDRVYISGFSRGGEVMSLAVSERPELYSAAVHMSSIWRGDASIISREHFPLYFAIGESDEAYGSEPVKKTYEEIASVYEKEGLSKEEMNNLLVLDIKDWDYFTSQDYDNQHFGADLFAYDRAIMGWLLNHE